MIRSRVLEVECFVGDLDTAADEIVRRALSRRGGRACFANAHVFVASQDNGDLKRALQSSWAVFPDGAPVAWLQRRSGFPAAQRIAGPDLMPAVFDRGREFGLRHFLFGSTPRVMAALESRISRLFAGINVVGAIAPIQGDEHAADVLAQIRATEPHVVWIALGAPKQELWAQRYEALLGPSLLVPVGAAFDFNAEEKPRAPQWMQENGLEWLHRLATEPRRLGWRYLSTNSVFAAAALRELAWR